jgi:hypothetical protein
MHLIKPGALFRLTHEFQYSFSIAIPKNETMLIVDIDRESFCDVLFVESKKKAKFMAYALPKREFLSYA